MLVSGADLAWIVERLLLARRNQRRRQQRLIELGKQRLDHGVVGDADTYRASLRMLRSARHFACGRKQEGVAPRHALFHDPELPVVELSIAANLGEIAADERQMMLGIDPTQRTNAVCRGSVPDAAAERIAGVCGIGDYAAGPNDCRGLPNQAALGVDRMDGEILSQSEPRRGSPLYNLLQL